MAKTDSALEAALSKAAGDFSLDYSADDSDNMAIQLPGVPLPHFCLRHFFSSDCLPLRRSIFLGGLEGTGKTTMVLEFMRILLEYWEDSHVFGVHNEDKWPDTLPRSIMGDHVSKLHMNLDTQVIQDWMSVLYQLFSNSLVKEPLNNVPIGVFVDSVTGAEGADRQKKLDKTKGAPAKDYSEIARVMKDWLPHFTKLVNKSMPMMFFVGHLKGTDKNLYMPGGGSKDFFSSYTIHLTNKTKNVKGSKEGTQSFFMVMTKDSYGPGGAWMPVTFEWSFDETGKQKTRFMWESSTLFLLDRYLNHHKDKVNAKHPLREVMSGFSSAQGGPKGKLYKCDRIKPGDPNSNGLTAIEFCEAMEQDQKFREDLDAAMNITKRIPIKEYVAKLEALQDSTKKKKKGRKKKPADAFEEHLDSLEGGEE